MFTQCHYNLVNNGSTVNTATISSNTIQVIHLWYYFISAVGEISDLLETGLDDQMLLVIVRLCELGVNPEALASIIQELQQEMAAYKVRKCG